jgi:streptogramin lyase
METPDTGIPGTISLTGSLIIVEEDKTSWMYFYIGIGLAKIKTDELAKGNTTSLIFYAKAHGDPFPINNYNLNGLFEDRSKNIWMGVAGKLCMIDRFGSLFKTYDYSNLAGNDNPPYQVFPAEGNNLWLFTPGDLLHFDVEKREYTDHPLHLEKTQMYGIAMTPGSYWLTTDNGLLELDKNFNIANIYRNNDKDTLTTQRFRKVFADRHGKLWVTTFRKGIAIFDIAQKKFTQRFHHAGEPVDLYGWIIPAISEDRKEISGWEPVKDYSVMNPEITVFKRSRYATWIVFQGNVNIYSACFLVQIKTYISAPG